MTYKTKLNEASEEMYPPVYIQSSYDENRPRRTAFVDGSEWTLKYLSEQGKGFDDIWLCDGNAYENEIAATYNTLENRYKTVYPLKVIDLQALLSSEAKRVELGKEIELLREQIEDIKLQQLADESRG